MTRIPMSQADEQARQLREKLDLSTAEIGLQVRTTNCLEEKGIFTVRELLQANPRRGLSSAGAYWLLPGLAQASLIADHHLDALGFVG